MKPSKPKSTKQATGKSPSRITNKRNGELVDWREETLARMRTLILQADPEMIEERKWKKPSNAMTGVPVWSHNGIVCTGETYTKVVKLTFAQGASLPDPSRLFNSSLEGNMRRAIDIHEGEKVDARAFKALVKAAVAHNGAAQATKAEGKGKAGAKAKPGATKAKPNKLQKNEQGVVLLSGGNPQIAKGDGDAPVREYIAAMPGWKSAFGKRLDTIIERNAPKVQKAVRWNSPFYGIEGQGWFLSFHVFTSYVKVTFFSGTSLRPVPPGGTPKSQDARWIDIYEDDKFDAAQMTNWVKQAAALPGWTP
jgi:hypothetical protein